MRVRALVLVLLLGRANSNKKTSASGRAAFRFQADMERRMSNAERRTPKSLRFLKWGIRCSPLASIGAQKVPDTFFVPEPLAPYQPEWCLPQEYARRARSNPVRSLVLQLAAEAPRGLPGEWEKCQPDWPRQQARWRELENQLGRKIAWSDQGIERLLGMLDRSGADPFQAKRWEANYDLTLTMLYKIKFMAMQCRWMLRKLATDQDFPRPEGGGRFIGYRLAPALSRDDAGKFLGADDEAHALDLVKRKHAGAPWAARAEIEMQNLTPFQITWLTHLPEAPAGGEW